MGSNLANNTLSAYEQAMLAETRRHNLFMEKLAADNQAMMANAVNEFGGLLQRITNQLEAQR